MGLTDIPKVLSPQPILETVQLPNCARPNGLPPALPALTIFWAAVSLPTIFTSLRAHPGTGKTTIALQFLLEGARRGQKGDCMSPYRNRRLNS